MKSTIAIPTHNRAASLRRTLHSLAELAADPELELECLVIANRCSDQTPDVVADFARHAPFRVRLVAEERQGSSFARNRAAREAQGELILFIDDDVLVEPQWASALTEEIRRRKLDVACGIVLPLWEAPPPRWLDARLYGKLAVHDPALIAMGQTPPERLTHYYSANLGMRADCFARFGWFREDLGVFGGNPMSGEDTELFARILRGGGRIGFASGARVRHVIGAERLSQAYFRRKSYAFGIGSAVAGGPTHNRLDKLLRNLWRMALARARGDRAGALEHEMECWNYAGYCYGRWKLRTRRASLPGA
jgi:glycosyltransferase involved in cell wall biosynthesis